MKLLNLKVDANIEENLRCPLACICFNTSTVDYRRETFHHQLLPVLSYTSHFLIVSYLLNITVSDDF